MSTTTDVLSLFKYDPVADADSTFNITQGLNNNWDKIDTALLLAIAAAGAYNPEESYAVGDYCTYKGKLHKCSTAIPTGEPWTEAHWTTTTVAAELAELSSQLSNRLPLSGGAMTGPISYGNDRHISGGGTSTDFDFHAGKVAIRLIPENAVGNDISKCVNIRDTGNGSLYPIATATPPQEFDLPLADGWTSQQPSTYFKTQEGIVVARIAIKSTAEYTSGSRLFTLPEGFRPSENAEFPCAIKKANLQASSIYLQTSGAASENHSGGESFPIGTELCALAIFIAAS